MEKKNINDNDFVGDDIDEELLKIQELDASIHHLELKMEARIILIIT